MNAKYLCAVLILLLGAIASAPSRAQITYSEDFTGTGTTNSWYYFNGACLTASSATAGANPGAIPGCGSVLTSYYSLTSDHDTSMVGGSSGFLGSTTAPSTPDPAGSGALRFTNGAPFGHNQSGAILSANTFNTGAGIQVTFKTVTYKGNSGGAGGDGADGISFFLMDGNKPPGLGAFGGSLAYSCANNNVPHDGLNGGYIGLGIDEYGNFLNGTNLVPTYVGTNVATGDNSAYGYGYKPGRIGLRGAGSISYTGLTTAYGTDPGNTALPYYPASLATSCTNAGGTYSSASNNCIHICSAGATYYAPGNVCNKACTGGAVYDPSTNQCQSCASVSGTYSGGQCTATNSCLAGTTYFNGTATCDSCPATGYTTGTYSNGQCANSCPTGYARNGATAYCYPTGTVTGTGAGAGFYCPTGNIVPLSFSGGYICYPTGLSYNNGNYCPSGQTITGAFCYPTGLSKNTSTFKYCPSGQTINAAGTSCYPSTATSTSGTNYCAVGGTLQGTTLCYPTGLAAASRNTTNYCATGNTITGAPGTCYPTGSVYGAGFYCPTGNIAPTAAAKCCATGNAYNAGTGKCANGATPGTATAVTASTAMPASLTMSAAASMTAATAATPASDFQRDSNGHRERGAHADHHPGCERAGYGDAHDRPGRCAVRRSEYVQDGQPL
jgi:hypothetical protein